MFRATQDSNRRLIPYLYGAITLFRLPFQIVPINIICHSLVLLPRICRNRSGLGSSAFARHYSRNHSYFLLLEVLRCFSSLRSPHRITVMTAQHAVGLSHSEIPGSKVICTLPGLIAAYHVLHRLREPRHPPCALKCFLLVELPKSLQGKKAAPILSAV